MDKYWNDLLFNVTDGNAAEMAALKRFDIFEVFDYIESRTESAFGLIFGETSLISLSSIFNISVSVIPPAFRQVVKTICCLC